MKPPENNFKDSSRTLNVDTSMSDSENIYEYKTNLSKKCFILSTIHYYAKISENSLRILET